MATAGLATRKLVRAETKDSVIHSYHDEEKQGLVEHLNFLLKDDAYCKSKNVPINPKSDLIFDALKDGTILCKLINAIKPATINESSLKFNTTKMNLFEMNVNLELCFKGARSIGCYTVNIGPVDFQEGKRHLILSVLWQLIKIDLLNKVTRLASKVRAEILDLGEKEKVDDMVADEILLRWVNHHLSVAGSKRKVTNFSNDIKDCEVYIILFNQLSPRTCSLQGLDIQDLSERANWFLNTIDRINCKKFINADDIVNGNGRLNIAFIAYIFNKFNQVADEPQAVMAVEVIRSAENKLNETNVELETIEQEIKIYQEKNHQKQQKVESMQQKIQEIKQEDLVIEEQFNQNVQQYKQEMEIQKIQYESEIEKLERELEQLQQTALPSEEELTLELRKQEQEVQELQQEQNKINQELEEVKKLSLESEQRLQETQKEHESLKSELESDKEKMKKELDQVQVKIDATGYTETKKKLEQVREQAKQLESNIKELKENEKQLKVDLGDAKEDKKRIQSAKKKIQDQLNSAKDNTEKMIKNRFETDKIIDSTTRQVRDLRTEVDRIRNDKIYIKQQTEVLKVEIGEAEEQLDDIKVEKRRLEVKKQEIQEDLMDREVELDQVLTEKEEKVESAKKEHREVLDKMKRVFESEKKEINEERAKLNEQILVTQSQLLKEEFVTDSLRRQNDMNYIRTRDLNQDVRNEKIQKEVFVQEKEKLEKDKKRTETNLEEEKRINASLEELNQTLLDKKAKLRENVAKQSLEAQAKEKESRELEQHIESMNHDLDFNLTMNNRIESIVKSAEADINVKSAELKDEKRRLKKMISDKKDQEQEIISKINASHGKELTKLMVDEEIKLKDIERANQKVDDIDSKEKRLEEKLLRTKKEIASKTDRSNQLTSETKKSEEKMKQLESGITKAMELLESSKKAKDEHDRDYEITALKLKKLRDSSSPKKRLDAENEKKQIEEKLAKARKQLEDKDREIKKNREDSEKTLKNETGKLKQEIQKDLDKMREKLEKQTSEEEEKILKRKQQQIQKLNESNKGLESDIQRLIDRKEKELEEERLIQEKLQSQKDRKSQLRKDILKGRKLENVDLLENGEPQKDGADI